MSRHPTKKNDLWQWCMNSISFVACSVLQLICFSTFCSISDACHTLVCAMMLLNTDLHGQNIGRRMTLAEFIENLADLNDGEHFPKDVLTHIYQSIKAEPIEFAL